MNSKLTSWCDGLIETGWLAAVIAIPLFFNIHSDRVFEPDKLTLLRSLVLVMSSAWLVKFLDQQAWRNLNLAGLRKNREVWRTPLLLPVVLLVLIYLVSSLLSVTRQVSWAGSYQRLQGTYTTLSYIVVFALAASTIRSRAQVRRLVTVVIITSIPISFYGMLQHFELDPLPWGGNTQTRIAGHMGNAIFIAAYLILIVPLTVARIVEAFTRILGDEELAVADVIRSSVYIFTLAIQLIAIYWTRSRGPWLGLLAGSFAFILILLVSLRNVSAEKEHIRMIEAAKALGLSLVVTAVVFFVSLPVFEAISASGRIEALAGAAASFAAFAAAVGANVFLLFIMIALRRGWRWLWLSWLTLALLVAVWLAAFNFGEELDARFGETAVLGQVTDTLVAWRELPAIGRLGRLLDSGSRTGKVRVLIWRGALELLKPHTPLQFPGGGEDTFNFLRPIIGYGPESMYVAYNRFYPPELATVEARNASPDRSHNETFDALVITGAAGFIIWQALYLSVFYYGFKWLGVVRSRRDRNLLIAFWIGGAVLATIVIARALGLEFLGVAVPLGSIGGLVLYLIYYSLFTQVGSSESRISDPFQVDQLLLIGLVSAILAHYVEIHFGIAIAATRLHFFVYAALMFLIGHHLPKLKAEMETAPQASRRRARVPVRRRAARRGGVWGPVLLSALMLALVIGIIGYEFTTYTVPPDKVIETAADLTTGDIFKQAFLQNAQKDFVDSPFIYLMMMLTWTLGALVMVSEMAKSGELKFPASSGRLSSNNVRLAEGVFVAMLVAGAGLRFLGDGTTPPTSTTLLGQSLLLVWSGLCLWAAVRLFIGDAFSRLFAGAVAMAGLLFSLPVMIAGGGLYGFIMAAACTAILYLLWDKSWQQALVPAGLLAFLSWGVGLLYTFMHVSLFRSSLLFQPAAQAAGAVEQLRVAEASQSTGLLTLFYVFVILLMLLGASVISWGPMSKIRVSGSTAAYAGLVIFFILAIVGISRTNMRIIQADIVYKRAKPFDIQASRTGSIDDWNIAVAIYEKAVDLAPEEDFYYLFLGRAYLEQSTVTTDPAAQEALLQTAERRLIEAQKLNPLNTDHTANLARLNTRWVQLAQTEAERQERLDRAEGYYLDALALSPQNSIIRNEYARLLYDLKQDCERALEVYDQSVQIDPFYETTYFARADVYVGCAAGQPADIRTEYYQKAAASLEDGLAINDKNVRAWVQLGQLYHDLKQYDESLAAFEAAATSNTGQIPGWNLDYLMAAVHRDKGDSEMARTLGLKALGAAPAEATGQIQDFLNQLSGGDAAPQEPVEQPSSAALEGDRPLAALSPAERNGYYQAYPPFVIDTSKEYEAVLITNKGEMRLRLFDDEAPLTVNNFVFLAQQGFYDGTTFHRVLQDFMAQGGDPSGTGTGGPGYTFEDETANGLEFDRRGLLAMANAGPNTNGSQFFITLLPTPWLNGNHTIFGELIAGDDVLAALTLRDPSTNPGTPGDIIQRIDIVER